MGVKEIRRLDGLLETESLDAGNVSHVCSMIHTYFGISKSPIEVHTKEFAEASKKPLVYRKMIKAINALVLSAVDGIKDKNLYESIKEEFEVPKNSLNIQLL